MAKKGFTAEQIINKLREAEIHLSQGETIAAVSKKIGVSAHTYYRWRKEYERAGTGKLPTQEAGS
jgi:putative transposase